MAVFPTDIVAEILSRLPVKPLLRFRSVCKIWCALIDTYHFIKSHLHRSIHTKNNRQIILTRTSFRSISLDRLDVAEKRYLPLETDDDEYIWSFGSCNGLLALSLTRGFSYFVLWNPSTRKFQKLAPHNYKPKPKPKPTLYDGPCCFKPYQFWFGYDALNDDYKVVSLGQFRYHHSNAVVSDFQLYSMKSNSWRTVEHFPYCISFHHGRDGALAHGALHWFADVDVDDEAHSGGFAIAAFDLSTEETRLVSLPDFGGDVIDVYMDLVVLEGCLCIVAYVGRYYHKFLGVWVMKDYGVGDLWNQLISSAQLSVMGSFNKVVPLAYSKNGCEVLLLQDNKEMIWFDLEHNAVRKIEVQGLPNYFQAEVVVQSLLPTGSGRNIIPEEQSIGDKKIGVKRA